MRAGSRLPTVALMKKLLAALGTVLGLYLIARAIVEPFVIDFGDASTYRRDWGGPSLAGVLLVHCGPGVVSAVVIGRAARTRWLRRSPAGLDPAGLVGPKPPRRAAGGPQRGGVVREDGR
jgi:hypothetical protein